MKAAPSNDLPPPLYSFSYRLEGQNDDIYLGHAKGHEVQETPLCNIPHESAADSYMYKAQDTQAAPKPKLATVLPQLVYEIAEHKNRHVGHFGPFNIHPPKSKS